MTSSRAARRRGCSEGRRSQGALRSVSMHNLLTVPKANIHVHLENALRPTTIRHLAARHGLAMPEGLSGERCVVADFADFFVQNAAARACLVDADDFGAWPSSSAKTRQRKASATPRL